MTPAVVGGLYAENIRSWLRSFCERNCQFCFGSANRRVVGDWVPRGSFELALGGNDHASVVIDGVTISGTMQLDGELVHLAGWLDADVEVYKVYPPLVNDGHDALIQREMGQRAKQFFQARQHMNMLDEPADLWITYEDRDIRLEAEAIRQKYSLAFDPPSITKEVVSII